jgi:hypothetical protein
MPIAPFAEPRPVRMPFSMLLAAALCAILVSGSEARAAAQTKAQQSCLNALYSGAGKVAKAQGKANAKCLKARQAFATEQLGNAGQEQTTDACLTNDVKGQVDKTVDAVAASSPRASERAPRTRSPAGRPRRVAPSCAT